MAAGNKKAGTAVGVDRSGGCRRVVSKDGKKKKILLEEDGQAEGFL